MMDHKTMRQRDAKAEFQLIIAGIMENEEKRKELIEKYSNPDGKHLENKNVQRILIGNWLNNGSTMFLKGATEDELTRVAEHVVVLLMAIKYNLDIYQSHKDKNLLELAEKYLVVDHKKVKITKDDEILIKRKELVEKRAKEHEKKVEHRKEMQQKIQEYLDSGCTYEYIADELAIPESTVRNIMKYHD